MVWAYRTIEPRKEFKENILRECEWEKMPGKPEKDMAGSN